MTYVCLCVSRFILIDPQYRCLRKITIYAHFLQTTAGAISKLTVLSWCTVLYVQHACHQRISKIVDCFVDNDSMTTVIFVSYF